MFVMNQRGASALMRMGKPGREGGEGKETLCLFFRPKIRCHVAAITTILVVAAAGSAAAVAVAVEAAEASVVAAATQVLFYRFFSFLPTFHPLAARDSFFFSDLAATFLA